jgi:hypothetical protein
MVDTWSGCVGVETMTGGGGDASESSIRMSKSVQNLIKLYGLQFRNKLARFTFRNCKKVLLC